MKRPLVPVALVYVAGILLSRFCPFEAPLWWLLALGGALGVMAMARGSLRPWLLWPLLLVAGWANLTSRTAVLTPLDLREVVGEHLELVTLHGTLDETPTQSVFIRDEEESWRTHAVIEVDRLQRKEGSVPAFGKVAVTTPGVIAKEFFAGQRVEVIGVLRPPKGPAADGLFDYRTYLRWQGIHYQLDTKGTNDWTLVLDARSPKQPPLADRFFVWAQRTLARGMPVEDESLRLLWAMTLGWKTALTDEVSEPFMRSGTMHIFAISGLHIALISAIFVALLRVLQVPRGACGLIVVPLIWFYTAATGWQASAIRSTIMMTVLIVGWSLRRPSDLINSLAASGLIILVWQPEQLFQASFQLSFFVVLSIALLMPPFEERYQKWLQPDPFLPDELRPRWRKWLDAPLHFLSSSVATSLASWLGSMPLIAYYFHLFTPGSLLANLLVVPISSAALACNLGALTCGDWLPRLGELFNHSAWLWMTLMVRLSEWATTLPGSWRYVSEPTAFDFAAYYVVVFLAVGGWFITPARRKFAIAIVTALALVWTVGWWWERGEVRIAVLNGANAIFADAPGSANDLLVDCGAESSANFIVKPFVRAQGVNKLPALLLTHGDTRHVGGFALVVEQLNVRQTVTSSVKFRSKPYRDIIERLGRTGENWRQVKRADAVSGWTVLHPLGTEKFMQADDSAIVLRGEFHGVRVLLVSDLGKLGQRALIESGQDLRADIVIAGMPTQNEPLGDALLDVVQPRVIIVQDNDYPAQRRASKPLRARLAARGVPVFVVTRDGTVTVQLRSSGVEISSTDGPSAHLSSINAPRESRAGEASH